jgi:hypothetical protein
MFVTVKTTHIHSLVSDSTRLAMVSVVLQLPPRSQTQIRIHKLRQRRHVALQSSTIYVNGSRLYFVHLLPRQL